MCNDNVTVIIEPNEVLSTIVIENECSEFTVISNGLGEQGLSAYQIAVINGFEGTEQEWLESLQAVFPDGTFNNQHLIWNGTEWIAKYSWFQCASGFTSLAFIVDTPTLKEIAYTYSWGSLYRVITIGVSDIFYTNNSKTVIYQSKNI